MCICKQRTPSRKSTTTTTTTPTAAAAAAAATPRINRRRPLVNKGMPLPHAKPAANKRSASQDQQQQQQQQQQLHQVTREPGISLAQISNILDPFFDTGIAVRHQRQQQQRSGAAAAATAAAATAAAAAATREFLTPPLHGTDSRSVMIDNAGDGGARGQEAAVCSAAAVSAAAAAADSGGALQEFMGSGNSAWVDMVQEMEAEKQQNDQQQQQVW